MNRTIGHRWSQDVCLSFVLWWGISRISNVWIGAAARPASASLILARNNKNPPIGSGAHGTVSLEVGAREAGKEGWSGGGVRHDAFQNLQEDENVVVVVGVGMGGVERIPSQLLISPLDVSTYCGLWRYLCSSPDSLSSAHQTYVLHPQQQTHSQFPWRI